MAVFSQRSSARPGDERTVVRGDFIFCPLTTGQSEPSCGGSGDPGLLDTVSGTARPGALERERAPLELEPCNSLPAHPRTLKTQKF